MSTAAALAFCPPTKYGLLLFWSYRIARIFLYLIFMTLVWLESLRRSDAWSRRFGYYHLCQITDLPKKQMVIYSLADSVCLSSSIEYYIAKQKVENVDIKTLVFPDSPHCEHFRLHETEYVKTCLDFLRSCVENRFFPN